jgi:uncharacterized protein (DUF4415 family)
VDISFDPAKNARNVEVHGISLARAEDFDWQGATSIEDVRRDYGEKRFKAVGLIGSRLYVLIHTPRKAEYTSSAFGRQTSESVETMRTRQKARKRRTDPDNPELIAEEWRRARPAREVLPKIYGEAMAKRLLRPRGRPKSAAPRTSISLRLPPDVLARWKATGPGWQTRMVERLSRMK